ncbi:putative phage tail protein [Selenomonas ruminantium subsp. lactilytica TAM6421]|uniref:Putative phage tail protein n=1 Tax=Selenomonas ruminantium subsp. lactilytica (strain NBRC 103574 / TAM6421) TaxID=927704 RepID=I0GRY2_SELRL|nr:hypothetical protein [Selenomonas ruminantium]BAL83519.1 putative phage tail protein [Selenomonas ruminantium subsp. lactilytica TAM6421]
MAWTFDTKRALAYVWENKGDGSLFDEHASYVNYTDKDRSTTGIAFNAGDNMPLVKYVPDLNDVWISLDYYNGGSYRWVQVFLNGNKSIGLKGTDDSTFFNFFGDEYAGVDGINTVLIHIDSLNDYAEIWINGVRGKKVFGTGLNNAPITSVSFSPSGWSSDYARRTINAMSNIIISSERIKTIVKFDTKRTVDSDWKYVWENKGDGSLFDEHTSYVNYTDKDRSITGIAFNAGDNAPLVKYVPNLNNIWISLDYYNGGIYRWVQVFLNGDKSIGLKGTDDNTFFNFFGDEYAGVDGINTVLIHIDSQDDYAEIWINGVAGKRINTTGLNGEPITSVSFSPSGYSSWYAYKTTNAMSNIIISSERIKFANDYNIDTVRRCVVEKNIELDTLRRVAFGTSIGSVEFSAGTSREKINTAEPSVATERAVFTDELEDYRYENAGFIEKTFAKGSTVECDTDKSQTGVAISSTQEITFPIKPSEQVWVRFDVYLADSESWLCIMQTTNHDNNGISLHCGENIDGCWINGIQYDEYNSLSEGFHQCLLHMTRATGEHDNYSWCDTDGQLVLYVDGKEFYNHRGNVNCGQLFDSLYAECEDGALLSNIIISNNELTFDDNTSAWGQWRMPSLTADGTLGTDNFACVYSRKASGWLDHPPKGYQLVTQGRDRSVGMEAGNSFTMYMADDVKVKRFLLDIKRDAKRHQKYLTGQGVPVTGYVEASNDGENFTKIVDWQIDDEIKKVVELPSNLQVYHYYRFYSNDDITIAHMNIDAIVCGGISKRITIDTARMVGRQADVVGDTSRTVIRTQTSSYSTERKHANIVVVEFDTYIGYTQDTSILVTLFGDTSKNIYRSYGGANDAARNIKNVHVVNADTVRNTSGNDMFSCDTSRRSVINARLKVDTCKSVGINTKLQVSTCTMIDGRVRVKFDTSVVMPTNISWAGKDGYANNGARLAKVDINIAENTVSDTIQLEIANCSLYPKDTMKGCLLDYEYNMLVKQTSTNGIMTTVQSMENIKLLTKTVMRYPDFDGSGKATSAGGGSQLVPRLSNRGVGGLDVTFYVDGGTVKKAPTTKATYHFNYLAGLLGLTPVALFDDFVPSNGCAYQMSTVMNLISNFFSWTKEVPWRQVNVFIRGNKIYAIQRGHEPNTVDISQMRHTRPVITRESVSIYKTWTKSPKKNINYTVDVDVDADTSTNGDVLGFSAGNTQCNISYDDNHRPVSMDTTGDDTHESVSYTYIGNQIVEWHTVYDSSENEIDTYCVYTTDIGNNHAMVSRSNGGSTFTTNMIRSMFLRPEVLNISASLENYRISYDCERNDTYGNMLKYESDSEENATPFPVEGDDINKRLFNEVVQYNSSKCKEQVTLDIVTSVRNGEPDYKHVIDFRDTLMLDGKKYYLQSNSVSLSTKEFRQSLSLVRWF